MSLSKPLAEFESVRTWFEGLRQQWEQDPDDWEDRLDALTRFCSFAGKEPDVVIQECIRETESGRKISVKGRRFYNDKIADWQAALPGEKIAQARAGNAVRSFLIHNGIFLQSGLQS